LAITVDRISASGFFVSLRVVPSISAQPLAGLRSRPRCSGLRLDPSVPINTPQKRPRPGASKVLGRKTITLRDPGWRCEQPGPCDLPIAWLSGARGAGEGQFWGGRQLAKEARDRWIAKLLEDMGRQLHERANQLENGNDRPPQLAAIPASTCASSRHGISGTRS
jgi:hypothetical protein